MQWTFDFQAGGLYCSEIWTIFLASWSTETQDGGLKCVGDQEVEGKRSNGNKGDETEEGAKVNGAAYRWKADHKEGATAW